MTNRRTSLPALRVSSPRNLSPKFCNHGYLEEISEFDVEPPFISPSSSSSAENSPRMLSPTLRPASARPFRRRRRLSRTNNMDDDAFDSAEQISGIESSSNSTSSVNDSKFDFEREKILHKMHPPERAPHISKMQQMRSFNIDCSGKIVDCGFRHGGLLTKPLTPRTPKSRRATCPEIWLSCEADRKDPLQYILRIYGIENCGKSTVIQQLRNHADVTGFSEEQIISDTDGQGQNHTINFMMNDQEIELELIHGSALEKEPFQDIPTIYMVVYSVDNRESFARAAQILYRLFNRKVKHLPLLLVGNKIDLQRRRKVTTIEGKMLSKIYKCGFVEVSSLMGMNMDSVWKELIKKIQHQLADKQKADEKLQKRSESKSKLATRILERGRQFAKSCESLLNRIKEL